MTQDNSDNAVLDSANELWALTVEVWNTSFLGMSVGHGVSAIFVLLVGVMFRSAVAGWMVRSLKRLAAKSSTEVDDAIVEALAGPFKLVPVIVALFFAMQILEAGQMPLFVDGGGDRFVQSLIAVALFWALHNAVDPVMRLLKVLQDALTPVMLDWVTKALRILFIIIGAGAVLDIWGIPVGPIIAGLGLFGVAVGLGAQDLFKNLIGGITVIAEKRFHPGDWIKVDGVVEGTVEDIGFRSTLVRRFDKAPVYVPNSDLSDAVITNFSRMTNRRIYWKIGVTYSTTKEQLKIVRDEIADYLANNDDFEKPPKVSTFVRLDSFNASSIDFMIYCFTKTTNWGEWLEIKEEFALAIKEIVEEKAGTDFAFPSQSIYIESVADAPEVFTPPANDKKESKTAKKTA